MARLVAILDSADADWRADVLVWDGWGRDDNSQPPLSDPPQRTLDVPPRRRFAHLLRRVLGH
jgi:hypothetical protein